MATDSDEEEKPAWSLFMHEIVFLRVYSPKNYIKKRHIGVKHHTMEINERENHIYNPCQLFL